MAKQHAFVRIPFAVALCTPAIRTVVVRASAWRETPNSPLEVEHEIVPVLAMRATTSRCYGHEERDAEEYFEEAALLDNGWYFDHVAESVEPILADRELGLVGLDDTSCSNTAEEIVACPWPEDEDEDRLAKVIERVRKEATEKTAVIRPASLLPTPPPAGPEQPHGLADLGELDPQVS